MWTGTWDGESNEGDFVIAAGAWMELGTWKAGVSGPCWTGRNCGSSRQFELLEKVSRPTTFHDFCGFFFPFFDLRRLCGSLCVSFYFFSY